MGKSNCVEVPNTQTKLLISNNRSFLVATRVCEKYSRYKKIRQLKYLIFSDVTSRVNHHLNKSGIYITPLDLPKTTYVSKTDNHYRMKFPPQPPFQKTPKLQEVKKHFSCKSTFKENEKN